MLTFHYLLNSMENAAQQDCPADHDYFQKRRAVLDYVASLERRTPLPAVAEAVELPPLPEPRIEIAGDSDEVYGPAVYYSETQMQDYARAAIAAAHRKQGARRLPIHDSDCAVHNEPAYPAGPCDCTVGAPPQPKEAAS